MKQVHYSKTDYVKSSPHFFRMISHAVIVLCTLLFCGSILVTSPLLGPADAGASPNPAKSAWFLLWIQELVSHGTFYIYPVTAFGILFVFIPWLPLYKPAWRAAWLPPGQLWVNAVTITAVASVLALTIIAAFFRGSQWQLVSPF